MEQMPSRTNRKNEYNKEWMRRKRAKEGSTYRERRGEDLLKDNKCPICEILLVSAYHTDCPGKDLYAHHNEVDKG